MQQSVKQRLGQDKLSHGKNSLPNLLVDSIGTSPNPNHRAQQSPQHERIKGSGQGGRGGEQMYRWRHFQALEKSLNDQSVGEGFSQIDLTLIANPHTRVKLITSALHSPKLHAPHFVPIRHRKLPSLSRENLSQPSQDLSYLQIGQEGAKQPQESIFSPPKPDLRRVPNDTTGAGSVTMGQLLLQVGKLKKENAELKELVKYYKDSRNV